MAGSSIAKRGQPCAILNETETLTATDTIKIPSGTVVLNHASVVIAATFANLKVGAEFLIWHAGGGTAAHTVTLPAGMTFDATNNRATLNALDESLLIRIVSSTRAHIIVNNGSVALSAV